MPALRADAARSRERILEIARGSDPKDLRLNTVARDAGIGVGTVYRHFPTVHALVEALSVDSMRRMQALVHRALEHPDAALALAEFLRAALDLQLENSGLQTVLLSSEDESEEVRELKRSLLDGFEAIIARARAVGSIRPDLTLARLQHLVCGVEHAVRLGTAADRELLLRVLITGIAPPQ